MAVYFICRANLVERFRELCDESLRFEGSRAIVLAVNKPLPAEELRHCIAMPLIYRLEKRRKR